MVSAQDTAKKADKHNGAHRKRWLACNYCRAKKVRCNGGNPCSYCDRHDQKCETSTRRRRGPNKETLAALDADRMAERLARLETLIQNAPNLSPDELKAAHARSQVNAVAAPLTPAEDSVTSSRSCAPDILHTSESATDQAYETSIIDMSLHNGAERRPSLMQHEDYITSPGLLKQVHDDPSPRHESIPHPYDDPLLDSLPEAGEEEQEGSSVYSAETYLEYQGKLGPRSFLSICSQPGVEWVCEKVNSPTFQKSATLFTRDITRRLKLAKRLSPERAPDPDPDSAWRYSRAFFENGYEGSFGILPRSWFEVRLRAHLIDSRADDDASWYALRHTIFAIGSRIESSAHTTVPRSSQLSWPYFENALSVHTELLFLPSSIVGVQALVLMAYYSEGLGSPLLQYILGSSAIRLACSKGLHREPASSWSIPHFERCHRNWIFWAIYCLDKHISSRAGRPSIMEDEEINCQIPTSAPASCFMNVAASTVYIKLHQLSSFIGKSLSSAKAFRQKPAELMCLVNVLDKKARALREEIQLILPLDKPVDPSRLPPNLSLKMALAIHFTYYGLLFDIHTTLTYPWSRGIINLRHHPSFRDQVEKSYSTVAMASREVILAARHIPLDASCPFLLAYYMPVYALINLFIHILQTPNQPSIESDLLLMEIGAGHFTRMELVTESQISTPFVKEISQMARQVVDRARQAGQPGDLVAPNLANLAHVAACSSQLTPRPMDLMAAESQIIPEDCFSEWFASTFDTDMDMWSSLLPIVENSPNDLLFVPQEIGDMAHPG